MHPGFGRDVREMKASKIIQIMTGETVHSRPGSSLDTTCPHDKLYHVEEHGKYNFCVYTILKCI